ncbi:cytochrome P450 [Achaetomium macrosporum]|uniref:Cytochrome P450 n=1 Tax=Achaetomium macrosporum TaxID=79813 RepID=A0AAN7H9D1_9PEZI|nr:cytochrome P450 [Achaetomium macrosporum]
MALSSVPISYVLWAVVALVVVRVVYELLLSPLRQFPGPLLAKFTDFYRAGLTLTGRVDHWKRTWHRRWGPAVRVGPNAISLNDPDLIKVIYTTKNAWLKTDMYRPNDLLVDGKRIQNIFNTPDKAFHAKYTKPIVGFWSQTKILELEPLMDETLRLLIDTLGKRFADTGAVCPMDKWVTYFSWDTAANVSFGRPYGFMQEGRDVGGMIAESKAGLKYFAPVSQIPWIDEWLDKNPVWRIGPRPLVSGFVYTVKILEEYRQQLAAGTAKKRAADLFIDKYNSLKDSIDFVDDAQVLNWLMINVLAGGDSTAGAMLSVVYHLGRNPDAHAKLVAELDAANVTMPAQFKDIKNLPYLDAVMYESQRISPALGLMLEREVPAGGLRLADGRVIPAGTKVGINPCVVTRDGGLYGDDVETFRPERWLRRAGETDDEYAHRHRRMAEAADFMFGAGSRGCMGKHFAKTEMYKLFATLYRVFDIKLANPDHEWKYFNAWFMLHEDIPMILKRRELV